MLGISREIWCSNRETGRFDEKLGDSRENRESWQVWKCEQQNWLWKMVFSVSDTGILRLKEKSKCSLSQTYDLLISTLDALTLSYRRLVVARPLNLNLHATKALKLKACITCLGVFCYWLCEAFD